MATPLFADLIKALPEDPQLTEGERHQLRLLCVTGGPMWKIVKSSLDFADHMKDHIAALPLVDEEARLEARQLQLKRGAALDFLKWMTSCIQGSGPQRPLETTDERR